MNDSLHEQALNWLRLGELDRASEVAEQALARTGDQENTHELWQFRFIRAEVMRVRGKTEEALKFLESLPTPEDIESRVRLKKYRGYYMGLLGRYGPSHRLLDEARAVACEANLLEVPAEVHLSQAFIFFLQENYTASGELFRAALDLSEQIGGWFFPGYGRWGVGKNLMIQGHYQEAIPWLGESLKIFEGVGARLPVATVWSELAVCYLGLGEDVKALDLFQKAAAVDHELGAVHSYQVCLANIGNVYLHRRDHLTAIEYYRRALAMAHDIKDPVSVKKWTYNINLAYARIKFAVDEQGAGPHA